MRIVGIRRILAYKTQTKLLQVRSQPNLRVPSYNKAIQTLVTSALTNKNKNNNNNNNDNMPSEKRKLSSDSDTTKEHVNTSRDFVPRYSGPSEDEMTAEQKEIRDGILKSRPGTGLSGPFGPWLAVPEIAQPAQALGRACRYGTSMSFKESELVILLTGAKTRSHSEFDIHVGEALKPGGLSMQAINAIPRDEAFSLQAVRENLLPLLDNEREKAIATFTAELLENYGVSDETYASTKAAVDGKDSVLVEITSISGYYTYVAYTLNVFRIPSK
jgi:4-carboxymuconolactone decarboxylase